MDANQLLERINHVPLLQQDNVEDWDNICNQFPYFASAQLLRYGCAALHQQEDIYFTALYKNDPLLFAQWVNQFKNKKPVVDNIIAISYTPNKTEDTSKDPLDILSAIEELPSTPWVEKKSKSKPPISYTTMDDMVSNQSMSIDEEIEIHEEPSFHLSKAWEDRDKSLMVMMSFTDWLNHYKQINEKEKEEENEKRALKAAWQQEKLASASDDDTDEIPESIFKQAMDSISTETGIISEALAKILAKQGKTDKAIDMYKKLSLRNPEKSTYFAHLIQEINQNID